MKKLKTWQIVLLIIFWPVGIWYLVTHSNKNREVVKEFSSNVVGCIYPNGDGTSRQTYITEIKEGDDLFFKPAPTEEYPDSIGVFTKAGKQIGVVEYKLLNELRGMYANNDASVTVGQVLHSEHGLGVSMRIKVYK